MVQFVEVTDMELLQVGLEVSGLVQPRCCWPCWRRVGSIAIGKGLAELMYPDPANPRTIGMVSGEE